MMLLLSRLEDIFASSARKYKSFLDQPKGFAPFGVFSFF